MPDSITASNRLLQHAGEEVLAALRPDLKQVDLPRRRILTAPGKPIAEVFFPNGGVMSIVSEIEGRQIEVGIFGREGVSGTPLLFGLPSQPHETFVQIPADGWSIPAAAFCAVIDAFPFFRERLLRYAHILHLQIAENAASNGLASIEQRLARWLLMCQDRVADQVIPITHEFLSVMLGVRRPTVTLTVQTIEGAGMIRATRGNIEIRDRARLLELAGESYGTSAQQYRQHLGEF